MAVRITQVAKIVADFFSGLVHNTQAGKIIATKNPGKERETQVSKVIATVHGGSVRETNAAKVIAYPNPGKVRETNVAKIVAMPVGHKGVLNTQIAKIISVPTFFFQGVRNTQVVKIISVPVEEILDPLLAYYLSLMTSEYQNSPNILNWLRTNVRVFVDIIEFLKNAYKDFDLSVAAGAQLDILGQLIGASRTLPFQPSGGVSPVLDDPTYQLLLLAKIAQNQWNGSLANLYGLWQQLFPGGKIVVQDNQNMTATIFLAGSFTSIIQDMIINGLIIPRPEGVLYQFTFATLPVFGFDLDNTFIAGFDQGHFA